MYPAQLWAGIETDLIGQGVTRAVEGCEGVGLAPRSVERRHPQHHQRLPHWVRLDQRLEVGQGVAGLT